MEEILRLQNFGRIWSTLISLQLSGSIYPEIPRIMLFGAGEEAGKSLIHEEEKFFAGIMLFDGV